MNNLKRLSPYFQKYKKLLILGFMLISISITLGMVNPYISKLIIDEAISKKKYHLLLPFVLTMLCVSLVRGLIRYGHSYLFENVSQNILYELRETLYNFLQRQTYEFYDKTRTGEIMARMTGDLEGIRMFFSTALALLAENILNFSISLTIMFILNVKLTFALLLSTPILLILVYIFDRTIRPEFIKIREKYSKLNTATQENITDIRVVKAFSQENFEIEKFSSANAEYKEQNITVGLIWGKFFPMIEAVTSLLVLIIFALGGFMVIKNTITIGTLMAFQGYLWAIIWPLRSLGWIISMVERANASCERVFGLLSTPVKIKGKPTPFEVKEGYVRFENVYFKHSGNLVLENINFEVKPKMKVAIMGPTGSGKSSIVNLIPRFYDVSSGRVLIDEIDVRDYDLKKLRSAISVIPQETFLFSDTIANNIAYGVENASLEDIINAAKLAQAHEFIVQFPEGYDTLVGERGIGLSGGQKQRIAIARALLKKPKILILDDATSAVDMETEYLISKALEEYFKDCTVFIIAHRISMAKDCDLILYLENGKIVEQGTHNELLVKKGRYYNIFVQQYKDILSTQKEGDRF